MYCAESNVSIIWLSAFFFIIVVGGSIFFARFFLFIRLIFPLSFSLDTLDLLVDVFRVMHAHCVHRTPTTKVKMEES